MHFSFDDYKSRLSSCGLKVTPQRLAVLEAILTLPGHPSAEKIIAEVHKRHPGIATGTVYNILETFSEKGIVIKVKTDKDAMRYDAIMDKHHHLYSMDSERIEDYFDEDINNLLEDYFRAKKIEGFEIKDIKLQLIGTFKQP